MNDLAVGYFLFKMLRTKLTHSSSFPFPPSLPPSPPTHRQVVILPGTLDDVDEREREMSKGEKCEAGLV